MFQYLKNKSSYIPLIVFSLISLTLVCVWFRHGNTLGGGEVGNPFYNIGRMHEITKTAWSDWGLGSPTSLSVGAAPYYNFFSILQGFQIPGFVLQAGFFFICLLLGLMATYKLTKEVFPGNSESNYYASAIFYIVNPYALVNIWNRFLPNQILFYVFLPFAIWLFVSSIKYKKASLVVVNALFTVLFSVAFIGPSQTILFWGLIFLVALYYFFYISKSKYVIFCLLASLTLWFAFNFFWISQQLYFRFSNDYSVVSDSFFTKTGNIETFNALSRELGQLSNLFLLRHKSFFNDWIGFPFNWPSLYSHSLALILQWLFLTFVLIFVIRKIKQPWVGFFLGVFFLGIFISKGNSPPLGEVMDFLFKNVPIFEFFRNPLEKSGMLISLGFAPLVAIVKKFRGFVWIYLILFLGFPFWSGLIFTNSYPPSNDSKVGYQVVVPEYYSKASAYFASQPGIFRFISFPLGGEGISNTWPKGYVGVEQSAFLFSTPSLSYNTTIPFYSPIVSNLEELLIRYPDFYRLAGLLNVNYLMFRPDFDFVRSVMRDPKFIEKLLVERVNDPSAKLSLVTEFSPLKIFKFNEEIVLPKIYPAKRNILSDKVGYLEDFLLLEGEQDDVITNSQDVWLEDRTYANIAHSRAVFNLEGTFPAYSENYYIFPYVSTPPDSKKYPLIRLREKLQTLAKFSTSDKTSFKVLLLGKRLKEVKLAIEKENYPAAQEVLEDYILKLPQIVSEISALESLKLSSERTWKEKELFETFSSHLSLLNDFEKTPLNKDGIVTKTKIQFRDQTADAKILPKYSTILSGESRIVFQWKTDIEGNYELIFPTNRLFPEEFLLPQSSEIQIDGQIKEVFFRKVEGRYLSLGTHSFKTGLHELQLVRPSSINLLQGSSDFVLETSGEQVEKVFTPKKFTSYSDYEISFDYNVFYGNGLNLNVNSNIDRFDITNKKLFSTYIKGLHPDGYWYDYKNFVTSFTAPKSSDNIDIVFSVNTWNNCKETYFKQQEKCLDPDTRRKFDRPTKVMVKNIKLSPKVPSTLFLVSRNHVSKTIENPEITFEKIDVTHYKVHVNDSTSPFLLVFSELYNSGWKVGSVSEKNHILVNGYANAWWIEKTGDFDLDILYHPQKVLTTGKMVSGVSIFLGILILCFIG